MTSRNDDRLLPCPFCGEKQIFLNDPNPDGYRYGSINCPACLVVMPGEVSSQDELIGCWNTRAAAASAEPVAWRALCENTGGQLVMVDGLKDMLVEQADSLYNNSGGYILQPLYTQPVPAATSDTAQIPKAALDWLFGAGPDADGKWFGEAEDNVKPLAGIYPRQYWWRSHFLKLIKDSGYE